MKYLVAFLGACSALSAVATFVSCRSCTNLFNKLHVNLNNFALFRSSYKLHDVFWTFFGITLVAHLSMASYVATQQITVGSSQSLHQVMLWLGAAIFVLAALLLLSCRIYPRIHKALTGRNPMGNKAFSAFFGLHSYIWVVLIVMILVHLSLGEGLGLG